MSKRLQVLVDEDEWSEICRIARSRSMTVAQWVREALQAARRREPVKDTRKKLEVVRLAARHDFPTADIDLMLAETTQGYGRAEDH